MTKEFEVLMRLVGKAVRGIEVFAEYCDKELLRQIAIYQNVWTIIYPYSDIFSPIDKYYEEFILSITSFVKQVDYSLNVIKKLHDAGFKVCLLKGISNAVLYPKPQYRISSDTDILIREEDEEKVSEYLKSLGYKVFERDKLMHHFNAYHPIGGIMEVHVKLYQDITKKYIMNNLEPYNEEYRFIEIDGIEVPVLGINDGLVYITAHYIKHFTNSGGGIRQMLDLLLYMEKYSDEIDFSRYDNYLKELHYDKLIDVVKTIGAKYWGFDYPIKYEDLAQRLLEDSQNSGLFGDYKGSTRGFYREYCHFRFNNSLVGEIEYMGSDKGGLLRRIFPTGKYMVDWGTKFAKFKLLLPLAWAWRLLVVAFRYIMSAFKKQDENTARRLELVRDLGMIK